MILSKTLEKKSRATVSIKDRMAEPIKPLPSYEIGLNANAAAR